MAYPRRGAWLFRNVDRAFYFTPTLESISITQEYPNMTAAFSCRVVDMGDGLVFQPEDEVRVWFDGDRIWAGHLKTVTEDRDEETGPRAWALEGQDYTAKLGDAIVRRRAKRKKEKALRRVRWLLTYMRPSIWTLAGRDLTHIPDEYIEPYDYYGATVDEALSHVADELRLHFFIDLDNVFQMYRQDTVAAPFGLDNDAPNYSTTFPFREYSRAEDTVELANAILVEPEKRKHSRWSSDATSIAAYGRQERFVSDSNLHRPAQALNLGARTLADSKDPEVEGSCVVWEPGIWAGMTTRIVEALWERDESVFIANVDIAAVDPHDAAGEAYLKSTLTFSDRRRRKRRGSGHGGRDRSINKNTRRRPGQTADVDPHLIDSFSRVVLTPTFVTGDALGVALDDYSVQTEYQRYGVYGTPSNTEVTAGPTFSVGTTKGKVESVIGASNTPWTVRPPGTGCGSLDFWFAGWRDKEAWWRLTVPAHPAGMAGITLTFGALTGALGVAVGAGLEVAVRSAVPTATWQGDSVGFIPAAGGDVFIPGALVPAEGGDLHIGARPTWRCDYGATMCGWNFPVVYGYANSGSVSVANPSAVVWALFDDSGDDMGAIATLTKAPWDGGNAWREAGVEGSPAYGVDGSAYYVTSTGLGGRGLYVVGEREDVAENYGPWSDVQWGVELEFEVDASGDTGTSGPRHIQLTTTGEGEQTVGTVHLGDSAAAEGISVGGPTTTDYAAKAIGTGERWVARFDSRSGLMKGKLWKAATGEPCAWDVEVAMAQTDDDADRFMLWVRCGNTTEQTVRIHRIRAQHAAHDGKRVVREWLGYASGVENEFATNHPFREGTLRIHVNGVGVPPIWEDGDAALCKLDFYPTARSAIRATYIADQGE